MEAKNLFFKFNLSNIVGTVFDLRKKFHVNRMKFEVFVEKYFLGQFWHIWLKSKILVKMFSQEVKFWLIAFLCNPKFFSCDDMSSPDSRFLVSCWKWLLIFQPLPFFFGSWTFNYTVIPRSEFHGELDINPVDVFAYIPWFYISKVQGWFFIK